MFETNQSSVPAKVRYVIKSIQEEAFPENDPPKYDETEGFVYEPVQGEKIEVLLWVKYPAYDFIFGVPQRDNPRYEKEVGFFQFRDTRAKVVAQGAYLDMTELEEMVNGFSLMLQSALQRKKNEQHGSTQ